MPHIHLNRGTVSLTERLIRNENNQLACHLRNAILASAEERIDLLLSAQQLLDIQTRLQDQYNHSDTGQQALIQTLVGRWSL